MVRCGPVRDGRPKMKPHRGVHGRAGACAELLLDVHGRGRHRHVGRDRPDEDHVDVRRQAPQPRARSSRPRGHVARDDALGRCVVRGYPYAPESRRRSSRPLFSRSWFVRTMDRVVARTKNAGCRRDHEGGGIFSTTPRPGQIGTSTVGVCPVLGSTPGSRPVFAAGSDAEFRTRRTAERHRPAVKNDRAKVMRELPEMRRCAAY